jgi:hypothetical protein
MLMKVWRTYNLRLKETVGQGKLCDGRGDSRVSFALNAT